MPTSSTTSSRSDGGRVEQHVEQIQVDQEVLAELVVRPDARLLEAPHEEGERLARSGVGGHGRQ